MFSIWETLNNFDRKCIIQPMVEHGNIEVDYDLLKSLRTAFAWSGAVALATVGIAGASYAAGWGLGVVDLKINTEPGGEYKGMSCERINVHAEVPEWLFGTVVSSFEAKDLIYLAIFPKNG